MRNTISSFVKNAICRFGNEAGQVLRAVTDPVTSLVRLINTAVRTYLGYLVPSYRLGQPVLFETSAIALMLSGHTESNRMPEAEIGTDGLSGFDAWRGRLGQTVS